MGSPDGFSEAVEPQVREAIEGELQNRGGGMLTGFLAIYTYIDSDGTPCWGRIGANPTITAVGMADCLQATVRRDAYQNMGIE